MLIVNKLLIATKNKGKVHDFQVLFEPLGVTVLSLLDLDEEPEDVEETGSTFEENAVLKAEAMAEALNMPVVSDDSGLAIDYLDGKPGVFSARYAGQHGDDEANIDKVLSELDGVQESLRQAQFVCCLAYKIPNQPVITTFGQCEGHITEKRYGTNGFGYDPIFKPLGYNKTMAELSKEEKGRISHRGDALAKLKATLNL